MASPAIQILVLHGWLGLSAHADLRTLSACFVNLDTAHTHPVGVRQLGPGEAHGLGPEVVGHLGSDDLGVAKEGWTGVLTFILDCSVLSAVEMSILQHKNYDNAPVALLFSIQE